MVLLTGYVVRPKQKTAIGKILLHIVWMKLIFNCVMILHNMREPIKEYMKENRKKAIVRRELRRDVLYRHKKWRKTKKNAQKIRDQ